MAGEGVIGSFGIDFLVTPAGDVYLSEINLRMGGTTHPYWMARLAGGAAYDPATGELVGAGGDRLCYTATDNLKLARLVGWTPADVIALVDDAGLAFDPADGHGRHPAPAGCRARVREVGGDVHRRQPGGGRRSLRRAGGPAHRRLDPSAAPGAAGG